MRLERRRGSRIRAALKGRQQGLEGIWQSQWAGIQYRLVGLFSGSFITAYARPHTAGVRLIPFLQQANVNLPSLQSLTLGFVFSGTRPCFAFVRFFTVKT